MEVSRMIELSRIEELKIIHDVRVVCRSDLNPVTSTENLHVQFVVSGDVQGAITCHLCLDGKELSDAEKNYLFPLFTEAMNILVGRLISIDDDFKDLRISISAPKLSMLSSNISTETRLMMQKYELDLDSQSFDVLIEYALEGLN